MKPSELIRRYGWVQRKLGNERCGYCLQGALLKVEYWNYGPLHDVLRNRLGMSLADWNDTPGRTKEEVLALLEGEGL